jgi:hypothetical protein
LRKVSDQRMSSGSCCCWETAESKNEEEWIQEIQLFHHLMIIFPFFSD